ncbi:MAG: hypothetical protein DRI90_09090, partial [Deltaproteobacteria bacterium]
MRLSASRNLLAAGLVMAVAASCMLDWDRLDPSEGVGGQGNTTTVGVCEPGTTAPCYSGEDGTEGVGLCVAGQTTCDSDGNGYGPCEGEVVPVAEDCDAPTDEDCD